MKNLAFLRQEFIGGISTFATMAYVLVVNASILSDAGMDFGSVMVATIIITAFASMLMGLMTNFPIAIAPGMGVSGYIAYTLVPVHGKTWQEALGAVFIVGIILLLLNAFKIRQKFIHVIPMAMRQATAGGVGLFLIVVGLKHVGIIKMTSSGIVALDHILTIEALLMLMGVALILILEFFKIRSAFIITIIVSWIMGIVLGLTSFEGFVSWPPSLKPTWLQLEFKFPFSLDYFSLLFSIFLVTLLDSSAALIVLAKQANLLDEKGHIKKAQRALMPDALGTIFGSLIGTGSLAIHLESAAGIRAGGKTGLVPILVGLCFLACLFFYPIMVTIPHFAPAAVLIVLGYLMFKEVYKVSWRVLTESLPVFITLVTMPLTMSIYNGFIFGFASYSFLKLITGKIRSVHPFFWGLSIILVGHKLFL